MRNSRLIKLYVFSIAALLMSGLIFDVNSKILSPELILPGQSSAASSEEIEGLRSAEPDTVISGRNYRPMPDRLERYQESHLLGMQQFEMEGPIFLTAGVSGFSGPFAPANWTFDADDGDGSVDTSGAPDSITLFGSDDGSNTGNNTTFCIDIPGANDGILQFGWDYETLDVDGPSWDPFGYAVNGTITQLTDDDGANEQSGSVNISIDASDNFCFVANSVDNLFDRSITILSNFSFEPTLDDTFTTSGTWTAPPGVTEITVEAWGGGGGGAAPSGNTGHGGGGGGAFAMQVIPVSPGITYSFTVGAGGSPGSDGGNSFFEDGSDLFAAGGASGNDSSGGAGGSAAASTGMTTFSGGNGGEGVSGGPTNSRFGGGGGGSAFTTTNGVNGGDGSGSSPGSGGDGTGRGGDGGDRNTLDGEDGEIPGGGGGGGGQNTSSGNGANGQIIISYTLPPQPDPDQTTINADPDEILANGTSSSLITVQVIDENGDIITSGGATVTLSATDGTLSGVADNNDGTYTATLTSSTDPGFVTISGTVNGGPITDTAEVIFSPEAGAIYFSRQSGDFSDHDSWSFTGHDGGPAGFIPETFDVAFIGGDSGTDHFITLTSNITLNDPGSITITDTGNGAGVLETGGYTISGTGTFELEPGGSLGIGSPDGISESGSSGSVQTTVRSFSAQANYLYNGTIAQNTGSGLPVDMNHLEINNPEGVTAGQSYRVNGTLFLTNGSFTIGDGLSLIANTKDVGAGELIYQLQIAGQPGYRLLSAPVASSFNNFLSGVLTQGFPGASLAGDLQPNVLWYDETNPGTDNQRWRAPGNASGQVVPGRGYHVFMFGDVPDDSRYNDPLPYLVEVNGLEHEGSGAEIDLNVTYTAEADTGWNLVGNPYGAAIDWEHPSWAKTNIDPTIYVWDPNTNQYLTWNGSAGDIDNGIIAPFQGFWVKASAENPELVVSEEAKTFGGSFAGKQFQDKNQDIPTISINARYSRRYQSTAHFTFSEEGTYGLDRKDAYKLLPPPGISDYLEVYSLTNSDERLAINNMPRNFGSTITIPFSLNAFKDGFPITDDIDLIIREFKNIPDAWTVEVVNLANGERFNIRNQSSITVPMDHLSRSSSSGKAHETGYEVVTRDRSSHVQFELIIGPGADAGDLPNRFELQQNYPNPFNPTTTLRFNLPIESDVRLEIFDSLGRQVATLIDGTLPAGSHERVWDVSNLSSGVYISRLVTPNGVFVKKLTLLK